MVNTTNLRDLSQTSVDNPLIGLLAGGLLRNRSFPISTSTYSVAQVDNLHYTPSQIESKVCSEVAQLESPNCFEVLIIDAAWSFTNERTNYIVTFLYFQIVSHAALNVARNIVWRSVPLGRRSIVAYVRKCGRPS